MDKSKFLQVRSAISLALLLATPACFALQEITEDELSSVTGAGLAFALDEFGFYTAPTSYIELEGSTPTGGWQRGDVRYYGLTLSGGQTGAGTGIDWTNGAAPIGAACNDSDPVGCPISSQGASDFAPIYSPYVIRAFQYVGFDYQGTWRDGSGGVPTPTVLELIGPSNMDRWRWAFWGEIEVGRNGDHVIGATNAGNNAGGGAAGDGLAQFLQSQSIINGKNATKDGTPAILRLFRTQDGTLANPSLDGTLGLTYQSALSGDFRFSVGQKVGSANRLHVVPDFDVNEGVYLRDVDAFLPMGRLHYQAITVDSAGGTSGNFQIDLNAIPNDPNIYNEFYCGKTDGSACATQIESVDPFGRQVVAIANPNPETHGYVRWGDFARPYTALDNGIYFSNAAGTTVHLGTARFEGMLIQQLNITTLSAGP